MYSFDKKALFVNDKKTKLYIRSLKNKPEKFLSEIEDLCEYGKPALAAEIVGEISCEDPIRQEACKRIYSYITGSECEVKLKLETLLLLGYEKEMVSCLNEQQYKNVRGVLLEIIDYHQEKSDYDFIYGMLNVLSQCADLSFLKYVLINQKGKGLYIYNDNFIDTIQNIICRVWNRGNFELVLDIQKLLWGGRNFFAKLGLSDDEIIETLLGDGASSEQIRIALYFIQNGTDDNNAYMVLLKKLKCMPDSDAVRLQRWSYMFKAYRENLIEHEVLKDYLLSEKGCAIPNIKNDYGAMYFTTKVFAKLAGEGNWPCYHQLKRSMGYNNVFSAKNVSEILPHTIYKQFENQEKIDQASILKNRFVNDRKKQRSKLDMYTFYMTSHFKYLVKLRYVLEMIRAFEKNPKNKKMGEIYDWRLHLQVTGVSVDGDKKIVCGRIRDCMTEKVEVIVSGDAPIKENMTYEIKMKRLEKNCISYEYIYAGGVKLPIIKNGLDSETEPSGVNEQKYDELINILDKMKTESVTDELLNQVRGLDFADDERLGSNWGFAAGFTEATVGIISNFAGQPEVLRQIRKLIEVLNEKKVNIYEYSLNLSPKRNKEKSRAYIKYYNKILNSWMTMKYSAMTAAEELSVKKDMVWIFMNSFLRVFYAADDLIRLICSKKVTQTAGFSECFEEFVVCGILNKSGFDSGSIYPLSMYLETGCRFCYEKDDYQASMLPDQSKVLFRLKRFRSSDVFVKELHEETESYAGEYEHIVGRETINSVMDEFKNSGLNKKYTYTKLLLDWCSEHCPDKEICRLPYSRSLVFKGDDVWNMQKNEQVEITGLAENLNPENGGHTFILSEFDIQNEILRFDIYE